VRTIGDLECSVRAGRYSVTLLIGAPGAGKGTQARVVCEALGIPHIASGDLLRDHRRRGTPLGEIARSYMDQGDLVPDDLVIEMVIERLGAADAAGGALLDGFPRTLAQAEVLDDELAARGGGVRAAVNLDVPTESLIARICGRRVCGGCGGTFHVELQRLPRDGSCPDCGERLLQREDDCENVVAHRAAVYQQATTPVLEHYRRRGLVHEVDGARPVQTIADEVLALLQDRVRELVAS
jgi:adenylate kinase